MLRESGIPLVTASVLGAFGCNFSGEIDPRTVMTCIERLMDIAAEQGVSPEFIQLADTMGWANPSSTRTLVGMVQKRWPDQRINLHLHDTRGMGVANIVAAMELGVDDFDSAVAGLGGCPFGGFKGAAGNVVTEDIVHMCEELGIETGVDLNRLVEAAQEAERIVGHPLPGKVKQGGRLENYRAKVRAAA
jgi:hydroxymethylglutaryl-CoA lyase